MFGAIAKWQLKGIEKTDIDPLKFRNTARLFGILGLGVLAAGAAFSALGLFPLGPVFLGVGGLVFFLPKLLVSIRAGSIREMLSTEMVFFTALVQMAFATKAHINLLIERMTRYRELPGVRTLAIAAWNNARMVGLEPLDAMKRAVEKLAPQKLVYRFNSLYTSLRIGEDIVAKLSLYMDMDIVEFSSAMQRRMDRMTSLISSLVVGLAMLSVTAVVIGRGNPAMLVIMGGLLPAVLGVVMALFINVPLMKMEFRKVPLIFGVASSIAMIVLGFTPAAFYAPLMAFAVALAGWIFTRERIDARAFERGFMDFVYTVFDELKRAPSVFRAVENAITFGDYGPFNNKAAAVLQTMKVGDSRLEDVVLKDMQPVMSVILRMLFDIYRLGTLPRATIDQLQNFVMKLFEYRTEIGKTLNITRFLALAGAAMVAFVNTSMIKLTEAMSKISGGAQLGGVGMSMLYMALGIMAVGYYFLFARISFSTRGGLLYLAMLYLAIFVASFSVGLFLRA
ncbi:type II secretion system F family protein [Pyrobaculum sp. 3827-6]|uniref:type II secretion system F family protein n=1 Tax=Pyrobaculum sp. 3827-6 TaxID=2983604 RepID=UPI0021D96E65|nr:type II secretion system F family protein [Pyrobaculum sp. 3827-6]MCU7788122.1 type II secretion system F family protein [Pyrobaculum sp. 3827-6]